MFVKPEERDSLRWESGESVKPLKLSAAMRIGAKLRPQGFVDLFGDGKSCALGAAYEGATGKTCEPWGYGKVCEQFPALGTPDGFLSDLGTAVYRMNDQHEMTREQIADWLESQGY
jgi:hypothetical protein